MQHDEAHISGFDNLQLYRQSWNPEDGRRGIVVIVHGLGEHSNRYSHVVEELVPAGYGIYTFDLRGHGQSSGRRGCILAFEEYREDLGIILNHAHNDAPDLPIILYGHSLGGLIALEYVIQDPGDLQGIIASAPAVGPPGVSPILIAISRVLTVLAPRMTLHTGLDSTAISRDPNIVKAYTDDPMVHDDACARFGGELLNRIDWVNANAAELELPLLVLQGGDDRLAFPQNTRGFFESAGSEDKTYREYPGGYHEPHNDIDHEVVLSEVVDWLNGHI